MKVNSLWRVEFRKETANVRNHAIRKTTDVTTVEVYAKDSEEAAGYACTYAGGIATKANLCCITKVM